MQNRAGSGAEQIKNSSRFLMVFSVDTNLILVSQYESKKGTAIFPGAWTTRANVPSRPSLSPKGNSKVRPFP